MTNENKEFLNFCLKNYIHDDIDDVFSLYKDYTSVSVKSLDDMNSSVEDFCQFLKSNLKSIKMSKVYSDQALIKSIDAFKRSMIVYIDRYLSEDYSNFAKMVFELSPSKKNESLLDVGAGRIPSTSIWLAQNMKDVCSIDTQFHLSKVCLKNMNVNAQERIFNAASSVYGYSFVVGRCPCSAIRHMVKKCAEQNIPYLIKLCDCDIVVARRYIKEDNVWKVVLSEYDSDVKFFRDYAYNIDASEEQVAKIIEQYDSKAPIRARRTWSIKQYSKGALIKECEKEI